MRICQHILYRKYVVIHKKPQGNVKYTIQLSLHGKFTFENYLKHLLYKLQKRFIEYEINLFQRIVAILQIL